MTDIQIELFKLQDKSYKSFHSKLIPTVNPDTVIGVRTPTLRKYARKIAKSPLAADFLMQLPHRFYEENNLHAFIIESFTDYKIALYETNRFLPFIDNWATCDSFLPKAFQENASLLLPEIKKWIKSDCVYTVRYGLGLLMRLFLDDLFTPEMLEIAASVHSDEYYVNMMIAWYFATALAKQYSFAKEYITEKKLNIWVHNKTIQKAIESYRISDETKIMLRALKIKAAR